MNPFQRLEPPIFVMFVFFGHWLRWLSLHVRAALAEGFTFPFRWFARLLGLPFAPRPGDTCVSPTWLTRTLRSKGVIPPTVHVVTAIPESLSGNRGLVGVMTRVRVTYSQTVLDAPATFILKMSRPGRANRRTLMAGGQTRESRFYGSSLVWQLPHGLVPICYYAHSSSVLGESVMLLEDCVGVAPLNFVFGNQIWGIPKPLEPPRDQLDTLKAVFQSAADQHVAFWKSPDLLKMVSMSPCGCVFRPLPCVFDVFLAVQSSVCRVCEPRVGCVARRGTRVVGGISGSAQSPQGGGRGPLQN